MFKLALSLTLSLAFLAGAAVAQDCGGCQQCPPGCDMTKKAAKAELTAKTVAAAREALVASKKEEAALEPDVRDAVRKARAYVMQETPAGQAALKVFVADALELEAAVKDAKADDPAMALAKEIAGTYRAMAVALDPKCFEQAGSAEEASKKAAEAMKALVKSAKGPRDAEGLKRFAEAVDILEKSCPIYGKVEGCVEAVDDGLSHLEKTGAAKRSKAIQGVVQRNAQFEDAISACSDCSDCESCEPADAPPTPASS